MIEYIEGNDAIVRGAIDAGCRFFAGYPITPATSILHGMINELPKHQGVAIQAEDDRQVVISIGEIQRQIRCRCVLEIAHLRLDVALLHNPAPA